MRQLTILPFPCDRVDCPKQLITIHSLGVQVYHHWIPLPILVGLFQ